MLTAPIRSHFFIYLTVKSLLITCTGHRSNMPGERVELGRCGEVHHPNYTQVFSWADNGTKHPKPLSKEVCCSVQEIPGPKKQQIYLLFQD